LNIIPRPSWFKQHIQKVELEKKHDQIAGSTIISPFINDMIELQPFVLKQLVLVTYHESYLPNIPYQQGISKDAAYGRSHVTH